MKFLTLLLTCFLVLTVALNSQELPTPTSAPTSLPEASGDVPLVESIDPEPTKPETVPADSSPDLTTTTPSPISAPAKPKIERKIPSSFGDLSGEVFIGQRTVIDRYAGWGWIKRENENWKKSRWVMLQETPKVIFAPGRYLGHPDRDNGTQYKLYGSWAPYKGYEPNFDVFVDVFIIKGFELIGPAEIPKMSPPRSKRGRSDSDGPYSRRGGRGV